MCPEEKTDLPTLLMLSPVLGLCVISLYYTNTWAWSVPFATARVPFEVLTLLLTLAALWPRQAALVRAASGGWRAAREKRWGWAAAVLLLLGSF